MSKHLKIKNKVATIIEQAAQHLEEEDELHVRELLDHNEWGIAFEDLCSQLYERSIKISGQLYSLIEDAGRAMNMDESTWLSLKELIRPNE